MAKAQEALRRLFHPFEPYTEPDAYENSDAENPARHRQSGDARKQCADSASEGGHRAPTHEDATDEGGCAVANGQARGLEAIGDECDR